MEATFKPCTGGASDRPARTFSPISLLFLVGAQGQLFFKTLMGYRHDQITYLNSVVMPEGDSTDSTDSNASNDA